MTAGHVSAAILAGGRARRFGGVDKCRLIIDGRSLIVRQIDVLQRVAQRIVVVANDPDRFVDLHVAVQPDLITGAGALGGLYTALATSDAERVIVVACDLPFLDPNVLRRLVELTDDGDGAWIASTRGVEPLIACYRSAVAPRIRNAIDAGHLKATELGSMLHMIPLDEKELATFGSVERFLANLNTPEDLARVQ